MADAIPVSDPGLLAAQAKAGQAGVDAFNAAISALQAQKQQAVQTALQEAALRGSPQGAAESQSGIISTPYDQRIASLTQGLGAYQASQAASDTRMGNYNMGVQAARSYIPQQVEMTVAPIRAEADFRVRQTEMEGLQRVSGINADTELTVARMRANLQAAQIAAAKKAAEDAASEAKARAKEMKLNQGELGGLLDPMVADRLTSSAGQVQDMLAANEEQRRSTARAAAEGMHLAPPQEAAAIKASQSASQAKYAAAYGGRGLAQRKANDFARAATAAFKAQEQAPAPSSVPAWKRDFARAAPTPTFVPAWKRLTQQHGSTQLDAAGIAAARKAALSAAPSKETAAAEQRYQQLRTNLTAANKTNAAFGLQRLLRPMTAPLQEARDARANTLIAGPGGNQLGLTRSQLSGLNPLQQAMVTSGLNSGAITSPEEFQGLVIGNPAYGGGPNEASSDIVRAAYQQSAQALLDQGEYNFGPEDLAASMPDKVPSIYDFMQRRSNLPSAEDQLTQAAAEDRRQAGDAAAADKAGSKQQEADAEDDLMAAYHRLPPSNLGTSYQVRQALLDNHGDIQQLNALIKDIIKTWDKGADGEFTQEKVRLKLMQRGMDPSVESLIPLAMYSAGS